MSTIVGRSGNSSVCPGRVCPAVFLRGHQDDTGLERTDSIMRYDICYLYLKPLLNRIEKSRNKII